MSRVREKWSDLDLKTKIAYITAIAAFTLGWLMTLGAFCIPPVAEVADSILWILGQSLLYSAGVLGVGLYVTGSMKSMKRSIGHFMAQEMKRYGQNPQEIMEEEFEDNDSEEFAQ